MAYSKIRLPLFALLTTLVILSSACGQKGPLKEPGQSEPESQS